MISTMGLQDGTFGEVALRVHRISLILFPTTRMNFQLPHNETLIGKKSEG